MWCLKSPLNTAFMKELAVLFRWKHLVARRTTRACLLFDSVMTAHISSLLLHGRLARVSLSSATLCTLAEWATARL